MITRSENTWVHALDRQICKGLCYLLSYMAFGCWADEVRFNSAVEWGQWDLPFGAVELTSNGSVQPVQTRKHNNAALEAVAFGGGIRLVGSNAALALTVLDGDLNTGWQPAEGAGPHERFIEVNLGRVVSAHRIHLVFAEDGPPFEIFDLLLSTGEQFRDDARVPIDGTLTYRIKQRFVESSRRRVTYEIDPQAAFPVHFVRVDVLQAAVGARLLEIEVEAFGDNLAQGMLGRGGNVDVVVAVDSKDTKASSLANVRQMIDGRISSFWNNARATRAETDVIAEMTFDLRAVYRVDHIRQISFSSLNRGFGFNFYEVLTSDGALAPDGSLRWSKHFSGWPSTTNRRQGMVDHLFDVASVRFVRVRWKAWDANCGDEFGGETAQGCQSGGATSEMQIFGAGFPVQVDLRSALIDLQGQKNINALRWRADTPSGSRVEWRSRSGNELSKTITYFDKNAKAITQKQWERLIPSFRGPVDTTSAPGGDWSAWSTIYASSGQRFLSPSMRRYVQLEARLMSEDPKVAASLHEVALDFSDPLAQSVSAEIYLVEVEPGVLQDFTYYVRPERTLNGFDRLIVEASTALDFKGLRIDGEALTVQSQTNEVGIVLDLPRKVTAGQLVEMDFAAAIFLNGTRFDLFLQDSASAEFVRQQVESGDAVASVASNTNIVNLPLGQGLIGNVWIEPRVLTPNGDGVNERLVVSLDLVNILQDRPVRLAIVDLAGRRLHEIEMAAQAGPQHIEWDGRDGLGHLLPPGTYLLRLAVAGDAGEEQLLQVVSVVY